MRLFFCLLSVLLSGVFFEETILAQETKTTVEVSYKTDSDVLYRSVEDAENDSYINERCRLDVYYPATKKDFPTIVWFHGGGLQCGEKVIAQELKEQGIAVVAVNYRFYPKIKCPVYLEDAAAAVAWTFKNISKYGGSAEKIFVSGHSAGGYIASMVGLDKSYLAAFGVDTNEIAGLVPLSGHTITHYTVRQERGIPGTQPIVDKFAPLYHVRKDAPPLILITGDRNIELLGRYEENAYLMRMMKVVGHKQTQLYEIQGHDHCEMVKPGYIIMLKHIKKQFNLK